MTCKPRTLVHLTTISEHKCVIQKLYETLSALIDKMQNEVDNSMAKSHIVDVDDDMVMTMLSHYLHEDIKCAVIHKEHDIEVLCLDDQNRIYKVMFGQIIKMDNIFYDSMCKANYRFYYDSDMAIYNGSYKMISLDQLKRNIKHARKCSDHWGRVIVQIGV